MQEDSKIHHSSQDLSITADQRPSRHRSAGTGLKSPRKPPATNKSGGAGFLVSGALFVLLAAVTAGGYWQVTELHKALKDTRQELQATRDQLGLVTGQVSQTGETISQSDSIFRSELKQVNSEIRKLWDVSNKRNRQWINENKDQIEQGTKKVDLAVKQFEAAKKSSDQTVSKLNELDQVIKGVTTEQLVANSDMVSRIEALKAEVDALKDTLSAQESIGQQIETSAEIQEELTRKLSAFQSQVSLRLQQLENTMRDLGSPKNKGLTIQ